MTKAQLDKQLQELRIGATELVAEMGYIDDAMAFDIADGFISDPEVMKAIKKYYPSVKDIKGFVANHIA